jgi:hypothetical protein
MTNTVTSGATHIDALLGTLPAWHTFYGKTNTLRYSFAIDSGIELGVKDLTRMSDEQQIQIRAALTYLGELTGISFVEAASGSDAVVHFSGRDLPNGMQSLARIEERYSVDPTNLYQRQLHGHVYFDSVAIDLTPGRWGYQLLLQELGHLMGLKHPDEDTIKLSTALDTTAHTLMSQNHTGQFLTAYQQLDLAALAWLYGGDGLNGSYGVGVTSGRVLMGTSASDNLVATASNDIVKPGAGDDVVIGLGGIDIAVFDSAFQTAQVSMSGTFLKVVTAQGNDQFLTVENFSFSNGTLSLAEMLGVDLKGGAGADRLIATAGHNRIDAGAGLDQVQFASARADYVVRQLGGAGMTVSDSVGVGGTDTLTGVERLVFADSALALDIDGNAGKAFRLYRAAFGRDPDMDGVGFWMGRLDQGTSLLEVAGGFTRSAEFLTMYGATSNTTAYVSSLYQHVLGRAGEQAGIAFWVNAIDQQGVSRAQVLADFGEQAEHVAQVIGTIQDGIAYKVWG